MEQEEINQITGSRLTLKAVFVFLNIMVIVPVFGQSRSFESEAWEENINSRQPPSLIIDFAEITQGMTVGEIGAGRGRITMWIAERIGPKGKLYATDIDTALLIHLQGRLDVAGFKNTILILGKEDDCLLPRNKLDAIVMVNTLYQIKNKTLFLESVRMSLNDSGYLVISSYDVDRRDTNKFPLPSDHPFISRKEMNKILADAGFKVLACQEVLEEYVIYKAQPNK